MASEAKNKANRINAKQSTGPRTDAGKEVAKYNRTCHGLAGKQIVIHSENAEAYEALRTDLIQAYAPANSAELALIEEVAQNFWRIQRGRAIEAETFNLHCAGADPIIGFQCGHREFENLRRYMGAIERAYHRAITQLHLEQTARRKREAEAVPESTPAAAPIRKVPRVFPAPATNAFRSPAAPPQMLPLLAGTPPPS